jgi:hypothetical protein
MNNNLDTLGEQEAHRPCYPWEAPARTNSEYNSESNIHGVEYLWLYDKCEKTAQVDEIGEEAVEGVRTLFFTQRRAGYGKRLKEYTSSKRRDSREQDKPEISKPRGISAIALPGKGIAKVGDKRKLREIDKWPVNPSGDKLLPKPNWGRQ